MNIVLFIAIGIGGWVFPELFYMWLVFHLYIIFGSVEQQQQQKTQKTIPKKLIYDKFREKT